MKFRKTILKRLFFSSLIMILVSTILILSITYIYIKKSSIKIYESNLTQFAYFLEPLVKEKVLKNDEIDKFIKSLKLLDGFRVTIIDPHGVVLGDSILDPKDMENHKTREEVIEALNGEIGRSLRFSSSTKQDMLYIAIPVFDSSERIISVLRVSFSLKELNGLIKKIFNNIILISIIAVTLALLLSFYFSNYLIFSLNEIKNFLNDLANKKFDKKIFIKKDDEFGEIYYNLNLLSKELKETLNIYIQEKEEINTILSSIEEAILVLNSNGLIKVANQTFKNLINESDILGKYYWEIIENIETVEFIKKVLNSKEKLTKESLIDNKNYLIKGYYLSKTDEFIFTFLDTSLVRKFEEVKRDFVRDASHELKTPLTAIKGFIETLEEENFNKKYIEIIKRNVDRMINIINDLLTLSQLEDKETKIELTEFDFFEMINNVIKIFSNKIKEKGLTIEVETFGYETKIKGDPYKLEQVFINLIDNAIKYTEKGGIKINYYLKDKSCVIEVIDSGIGIPKEHINRIFERFYVVDKSRSRRLGGTGLGLSIVKHIILLHGGKIEVESEVSKGSKFIITLPQ